MTVLQMPVSFISLLPVGLGQVRFTSLFLRLNTTSLHFPLLSLSMRMLTCKFVVQSFNYKQLNHQVFEQKITTMKTINITLFAILIALSHVGFSQAGPWAKDGNSLSGPERLGSTNAKSLNFITKNSVRMTLDTNGRLGFDMPVPKAKIHVFAGNSGPTLPADPTVPMIIENSTNNFIKLLSPTASANGIIFANSGDVGGSLVFNGPNTRNGFELKTGNLVRLKIDRFGLVGIGTTNPQTDLHVVRGSIGATPHPRAGIVLESVTSNFINLLNPTDETSGILFGNPENNSDGGIIYNGEGVVRGLQFNTGGNATRMSLTSNGRLGLGTKTPTANFHIVHGNKFDGTDGLRIQNNINGKSWTLFTFGVAGSLEFNANGFTKAFIDGASGGYFSNSDARLKRDVEKAPDVLGKVMQLAVKKYHFLDNNSSDKKHYGIIAQEVEKFFPEVVAAPSATGTERYAVNYSAFGVIAIKAIQEQQQVIEKQQSDIEEMRAMINELKGRLDKVLKTNAVNDKAPQQNDKVVELTGATLLQNAPNPFNGETIIKYYLPDVKGSATIDIVSQAGQLVKTFSLNQKGHGQLVVRAGELASGTYTYLLKIDGVRVDAKQMVLVK